jgi:hypothetical protein
LRVNIERHCVKITNNNPKEVKKMISILDGAVKIGEKRGEERGEKRGEKRGEERGIRIGEERGVRIGAELAALRVKKDVVLTCLSTRFKRAVPSDIRESVESYSDAVALDSLFQSALTCKSFSEFKKDLVR